MDQCLNQMQFFVFVYQEEKWLFLRGNTIFRVFLACSFACTFACTFILIEEEKGGEGEEEQQQQTQNISLFFFVFFTPVVLTVSY